MTEQTILDMCCGSRMFWFDKRNPRAVYLDARCETHKICDGRTVNITPDIIGDFRQLPFADNSFRVAVFDPPHLRRAGLRGWMRKKYGCLDKENWRVDIAAGFCEAFRVLTPGGDSYLQVECYADPGESDCCSNRPKTRDMAAHRQERQNPLASFR